MKNDTLRNLIMVGLFALLFIPLLVTGSMYFPFITGKAFAFRIIVEVVFALWLILALKDPSYRPRRSGILVALGGFVGAVALATAFGANPAKSFWSNFERMEGLITYLHLLAYFVVAVSIFRSRQDWHRFFNVSLLASAAVGVHAVVQSFGGADIHQGDVRLDASFGNAAYLAVYVLFHVFFGLYFAVRSYLDKRSGLAWLYGGLVLLNAFALYGTATRGTILGLLVGVAVMAVALGIKGRGLVRKISLGAIVGVALLVGGFWELRDTAFVQESPVLSRFANISLSDSTTESRFTIWGMSWRAFQERPILGWGPENFNLVFNRYYEPKLWRQEPWFDRAHNVFFDWLISAGALGLLAYLSLFAAGLWYLWELNRPKPERGTESGDIAAKAIFTGLLAAYFVHNVFVFDNLMSYILFASVLGYIHVRSADGSPLFGEARVDQKTVQAVSAVVLVVLVAGLYFFNWRNISASQTLIQALKAREADRALEHFEDIFASGTFAKPEVREQLLNRAGAVLRDPAVSQETKRRYLVLVDEQIEAQLESAPQDARYYLFFGSYLRGIGRYDEALALLKKAQELTPGKQAVLFEVAQVYGSQGRREEALEVLKQAYLMDVSYPEARKAYALALISAGRQQEAEEVLEPGDETDDRFIAVYAERKRYDKVVEIWQRKVEADPANQQFRLSLAAAYFFNGQPNRAIAEIEKVAAENPDFRTQANYYIGEIRAGRLPQ